MGAPLLAMLARDEVAALSGAVVPLITFYPAVMLAAWYGGRGPGLLATAVSMGCAVAVVAPVERHDTAALTLFVAVNAAIVAIAERAQRAQRRVDAARRETERSEERLRVAQMAGRIGTFEWLVDDGQVTWSVDLERLYGLPPGAFAGSYDAWLARMHPDDRERVARELVQQLAASGVVDVEFRAVWPDGSVHWVASRGAVVGDEPGRGRRFVGVNMDIEARKQVESDHEGLRQAADDSEARLRLALAAARMGTWEVDFRTGRGVQSAETAAMFGGLQERFVWSRDAWLAVVHPDDRTRVAAEFDAAVSGTADYDSEYRTLWRDGVTSRWVAARGTIFRDDAGRPARAVGVMIDVTDRRHAETARRRSETLYRAIGESMDYGIWVTEPDGRNVYASESFLALVGLTQAECSEFGWGRVLHPDDAEATLAAWNDTVRSGTSWEREHRVRGVDGRWHHLLARGVPIRNADGSIACWAGINLDITALKQAQEALHDADRRKDEFLAMLGHELRNPLAAIRNAVIIGRLDPARRERALDIARRQVEQLARVVDDLLDVARITQGRINLRRERVVLSDVVERALEATRPLIEEGGHTMGVSLPAEAVRLEVDPARLEQVVVNLLANAARYTPPGGRVDLIAERGDDVLVLRVRDSGIGISAEMLPRVFDLFAQAERGLDRTEGGLGIGLTIVRRLVELHGGNVEARSDGPGCGAEFIVRLPVLPAEPDDAAAGPPAAVAGPAARVLVVEDNVDAADSMLMLLELLGHRVHVVHDGLSALEALQRDHFDVALVDIGLPGINGYEVARRARALGTRALLLVAMTGYGRKEDRDAALAAGFDHHLVKPVDVDLLHRVLQRGRDAAGEGPTVH